MRDFHKQGVVYRHWTIRARSASVRHDDFLKAQDYLFRLLRRKGLFWEHDCRAFGLAPSGALHRHVITAGGPFVSHKHNGPSVLAPLLERPALAPLGHVAIRAVGASARRNVATYLAANGMHYGMSMKRIAPDRRVAPFATSRADRPAPSVLPDSR